MPDKDRMLKEAVAAGQSGDLPRARELLLKLLDTNNQEPLYWLLMSTAVQTRKERIYCLQNVLKLDPDNSAARHDLKQLGVSLPENGRLTGALEPAAEWQTSGITAPDAEPSDEPKGEEPWSLSWVFGSLGLGVALIFFGYFLASSGLFSGATPQASPSPFALQTPTLDAMLAEYPQMAQAHLEGGEPQRAIELLGAYLNQHPEDAAAWQLLGLAHLQAEEPDRALRAFGRALELNDELPQAAYYTGVSHIARGDAEAALDFLPIAVDNAPHWFEARVALVEALLQSGNPGSAFFELNAGTSMAETNREWAAIYYWRAVILDEMGQPNVALPDWLSLMALPAEDVPVEWRQMAEQRLQVQ